MITVPAGHIIPLPGLGPDTPTVTNDTGAKQSGIPYRCDLLPPVATLSVANVLHGGVDKYGVDNWRGIPVNDHLNHAITHIFAFLAGDKREANLPHAAARVLFALELQLLAEKGER